MAGPYWIAPGTRQGRIQPAHAAPADGSWVFCLGWDGLDPMPDFVLETGETIAIEQSVDIDPIWDFITLMWKMRTPQDMPAVRTILASGNAYMRREAPTGNGLLDDGGHLRGLYLPGAVFLPSDGEQELHISNIAASGSYRCSAVLDPDGGGRHYAVLESSSFSPCSSTNAIVQVYGARWVANAYVDGVLRASLVETARHEVTRKLDLHISQATGATLIRFELSLEQVTS